MNTSRARFVLGVGIPAASLAVALVPYLALRSTLPDRLATHFDASGVPDGSMAAGSFLAVMLVMIGAGVGVCVWLARRAEPLPASVASLAGFLGGFFAGLGAGIVVATVLQQRDLESWTEADGVWVLVVVPLVLSAIAGALSARAASALPHKPHVVRPGTTPTMDLAAGQHAVWTQTLHSPWLARLGVASIALGVLVALGTARWIIVPTVVVGVITLSLATLRVRADKRGLHISYGLLPWPRTHIDVRSIELASVIDVRPMEWGGWGYRGSLKLMKQAAVVHRAGPGIRLDLSDGKVFVVTVDDPATAAGLLNAEVARSTQAA